MSHYATTSALLRARAHTVFHLMQTNQLQVYISHRLPLTDAPAAHRL
ncbi:MAG: hypothetical protein H7Y11_05200, partial [Armatimonadetes bacterium]|nr:hypothetical protein [Anaerolineae bacterium]